MKKFEYLRELKENLETKLSQEEINDILSDYESFFHAGKEEGKMMITYLTNLVPQLF